DYERQEPLCWGADLGWNSRRDYAANRFPAITLRHRTAPPAGAAVEVPALIGACYAMRRDPYLRLGGFSPHFRSSGSAEQEIRIRGWMGSMRVVCATHARVGHLSRSAFPYSVRFEELEFNQSVMFRSLFERATLERVAADFEPLPAEVAQWLAATDL